MLDVNELDGLIGNIRWTRTVREDAEKFLLGIKSKMYV
jgi:hypothetical protein